MASPKFPPLDVDYLMQNLHVDEKIALTAGRDLWHTLPVRRLNIPSIRLSDGPNGLRGTSYFKGVPSSCFPCGTGLGASWDVDLLQRVGEGLGRETIAKGAHVFLGPTVNIQRSPLGGRGFESYSEDPFLSGTLARALIEGVQSKGIAATIKHFAANDQELERYFISAEVSRRALREIHLRPFELAIRSPNPPWAVMTAYNRLNGVPCSEHPFLLDDVLHKEWTFKGLVMSDWNGTYSTDAPIRAGLDLEMPGPTIFRGPALQQALTGNKVSQSDIDARARSVLELVKRVQPSGVDEDAPETTLDTPEVRALLREAASSAVVLLKNETNLLPLTSSIKSLAIIGPDAKIAVISGGGSASLLPSYTVTPFDAISAAAKEAGIKDVRYARGGDAHKWAPLFGPELIASDGQPGVDVKFFVVDPVQHPEARPVHQVISTSTNMYFRGGVPLDVVPLVYWAEVTGKYTPKETGEYEFGLSSVGRANLFINNAQIIDNSTNPVPGDAIYGNGSKEVTGKLRVTAGQPYNLLVRYSHAARMTEVVGSGDRGGIRIGGALIKSSEDFIKEAVAVAKAVSAVVLLIGLNGEFESETYDRPDMRLPLSTNALAEAILKANRNTAVVVQSGAPVEMSWANGTYGANSLLQAFYGGNEVGNGIADVLFGKVNPSARLPITFPQRLEDNPSYLNFGDENGKVYYAEGIFVGYRHFEKTSKIPLFPFGAGKSYTTFSHSAYLTSSAITPNGEVQVKVTVKNTGSRVGRETVQVYVQDVQSSLQRPVKELKGFAKTPLLKPNDSQQVEITLDRISLGFFDGSIDKWVAEKGNFLVYVGSTSTNIHVELTLELTESFSWI